MENSGRSRGFSLIEMLVVVGIIGIMSAIAAPALERWQASQRLRSAGQSMAAAFVLAHGEAIRTGNLHIVFFQTDAQGNALLDASGTAVPILVIDDGRPGDANQNCQIDAGETIAAIRAEQGVAWGVANATVNVPSDSGAGAIGSGSSFTDPNSNAANWTLFRPAGLPVTFTPACVLGGTGSGAGGVYVTNGRRDYAVVLSPLGAVRSHNWDGATNQWTN